MPTIYEEARYSANQASQYERLMSPYQPVSLLETLPVPKPEQLPCTTESSVVQDTTEELLP